MLSDVVGYLRCPVCRAGLVLEGQAVRCPDGHSFDVSRHGYVSLLGGGDRAASADTVAMIEAREAFLGSGHFASLAGQLVRIGEQCKGDVSSAGCIVDVGGGTGYYLAALVQRDPERAGIVLDVSKYAARRAARAHPRIGAVVADTWQPLPVRDEAAALVLNVFAPRNAAEFHRMLRPDGALIIVTPTARHLRELVGELDLLGVDTDKESRLSDQLSGHFTLVSAETHERAMQLSADAIEAVIGMGPSAHHSAAAALRGRIDRLPEPFAATLSVTVATYQKRL